MSELKSIAPTFRSTAFTCPNCLIYASHNWYQAMDGASGQMKGIDVLFTSLCLSCKYRCAWYNEKLVYPDAASTAPIATEHMPANIKLDFDEARDVLLRSPRAACALLRLCIQKVCIHIGKPGKNINQDIGELVKAGLPERIQQALDTVRVIGNNAVHPGEIALEDDEALARFMFELVNVIVDDLIGKDLRLAKAYESLPESVRIQIAERDKLARQKESVDL